MSDEENDLAIAMRHLAETRALVDGMVNRERNRLTEALREAREAKGLTQQQVADVIGLVRSQVANIEAGNGASVEALIGYAAAVGLRLALLPEGM